MTQSACTPVAFVMSTKPGTHPLRVISPDEDSSAAALPSASGDPPSADNVVAIDSSGSSYDQRSIGVVPNGDMLEATPELLDELRRKSDELEASTPQDILRWTVARFAPRFTMATAFG